LLAQLWPPALGFTPARERLAFKADFVAAATTGANAKLIPLESGSAGSVLAAIKMTRQQHANAKRANRTSWVSTSATEL